MAEGAKPFWPGSSAGQAGLELASLEELPASSYLVERAFLQILAICFSIYIFRKGPNTCIYLYFLLLPTLKS